MAKGSAVTGRRLALLLVLAAMFAASQVGWAGAAGGPVAVDAYNDSFPRLSIVGTTTSDDIRVGFIGDSNDGEFVVDSPDGIATSSCSIDSSTHVRCPHYNGGVVAIWLRGGDDTLNLNTNHVRGGVAGGLGNDTLLGSRRHNFFDDGPGIDLIKGARGPDLIYAQGGRDAIYGQRGADTIYANDDQRDKVINCGPGNNDLAIIDRHLDPKPIGCETVRYKLPPLRELRRDGVDPRSVRELERVAR